MVHWVSKPEGGLHGRAHVLARWALVQPSRIVTSSRVLPPYDPVLAQGASREARARAMAGGMMSPFPQGLVRLHLPPGHLVVEQGAGPPLYGQVPHHGDQKGHRDPEDQGHEARFEELDDVQDA